MRTILKIWQYALGSYSDDKTKPYDKKILVVRTLWVLLHIKNSDSILKKIEP